MITIDPEAGFCPGVTSAIRQAEEGLQCGPLYCLGDIVHNGEEVNRLADLGLITIDQQQFAALHDATVLLRAHGEPPATYALAERNNIRLIDASCPVVLGLQKRIRRAKTEHPDAEIVIFGKPGHAEVIGLEGQTDNTAIVIEHLSEIEKINFQKDIFLFSQTTKDLSEFHQLIDAIETRRQADFRWYDTICRQVSNRSKHIQEFAAGQDSVLFVGGKKSSNAKVLFALCKEANPRTFFISDPAEITPDMLSGERIGITGATSTPLWLMEQCKAQINGSASSH